MHYWVFRGFPKRALSRLAGWLAGRRRPRALLRLAIRLYVRVYRIDMAPFEGTADSFETFNAFFARPLRPGRRPIAADPDAIVSPVDGRISALGKIDDGRLPQVKGVHYSLGGLLAGDESWTDYLGGQFVTLYLAPPDYHRIHAPVAGMVRRFRYIPGEYWSVGPAGLSSVPRLYERNERLVTFIEAPFGAVAVIAVGAMIVGGIRVVYHPHPTGARAAGPRGETLAEPYRLEKGAELGRFELGSSVVLLMRKGEAELRPLRPGDRLRMGEPIATLPRGARP